MAEIPATAQIESIAQSEFKSDLHRSLTSEIIGAAIEVHRALGPGLLESAYQAAMCRELSIRGIEFLQQVDMPLSYKGVNLDCGYRIDLIVGSRVVVELKAVQEILPRA